MEDDFTDEDKVGSDQNYWDYKSQKTLIGVIVEKQTGRYGEQFVISTGDGKNDVTTLPNLTALDSKLKEARIGMKCKIVHLGEAKSETTGRSYEDFEVFLKSAD